VDEDADYLYDHILCIPIDQRYGEDDMKRVINTLIQNK
jgi:dTDP-4-amino-4,6-dideoxygalactose transaminase